MTSDPTEYLLYFRRFYSATLGELKIEAENEKLNDFTANSPILIMIISYQYFLIYSSYPKWLTLLAQYMNEWIR